MIDTKISVCGMGSVDLANFRLLDILLFTLNLSRYNMLLKIYFQLSSVERQTNSKNNGQLRKYEALQ